MKYVKTYENYKKYRNEEVVNEELFGLGKFLLGLFKKLGERITKMLGDNPNITNIDELVEKVYFNPADKDYIFKTAIDEFKKRPDANNEDCFKLVDDVLGAIAPENQQVVYDELLKKFGKNIAPIEIIKYYLSVARNRAIKDFKYAGGPDAKPGEAVKIDPKLKKLDLNDATHLPELKKLLIPTGEDRKKKKEVALNWVEKTLIPKMLQYIQAITEDQIREYLKTKGLTIAEGTGAYKAGDSVMYKADNWEKNKANEVWNKLTDEEKKDPNGDKLKELIDNGSIGIKIIKTVEKDFVRFTDVDWIKKNDEILGKVENVKSEYKVGDTVVYKRKDFVQDEWDKLSDDDKKDKDSEKMKALIEGKKIGIETIKEINDKEQTATFKGNDGDFKKSLGDILLKLEVKAEGQDELVKKLGELKAKKPEDIQKVGKFVDFISDDANKDKIADIDKIIGTEGGV